MSSAKMPKNGQDLSIPTILDEIVGATPCSEGKTPTVIGDLDLARLFDSIYGSKEGFDDTGKYDDATESRIREWMATWVAYAESGHSYDPDGNYRCGDCAVRYGEDKCGPVSGDISFTAGSCRLYVHGPDDTAARSYPRQLTQIEAQYGERPETKAFGCSRCEYASKAKKPDAQGRKSWCGFFGVHVIPTACCSVEEGPDSKGPKE